MFAFFAVTAVTKFSSDGSFLQNSYCNIAAFSTQREPATHANETDIFGSIREVNREDQNCLDHRLVSDVARDFLHEGIKGHHTEVNIAPGAHCNDTCFFLFVAHDKDKGQLLH